MDFRLEPVQDDAYVRRADRIKLFLGPPYLVAIGAAGADDQKDGIDDAREQQRIISCQNRGRIQYYDAELLRN